MARRSTDWEWNEAVSLTTSTVRLVEKRSGQRRSVRKSVVVNPYSTGRTTAGPTRLAQNGRLRNACKGHEGHPRFPKNCGGNLRGMAHPVAVKYFQRLGVTAVELLPVHQFAGLDVSQKARNYWGYNSIGYLAPHNEYGRGQRGSRSRSSRAVKTMHDAGIEVTRRGLQPYRGRESPADALGFMASTMPHYRLRATTAATMDYTGPATRRTCGTRTCCSSS